jgi:hypothetical protein
LGCGGGGGGGGGIVAAASATGGFRSALNADDWEEIGSSVLLRSLSTPARMPVRSSSRC